MSINFHRGNQKFIRVNHRIRVPEVRLIDSRGNQVGVLPTGKALEMALNQGLDLVEVAPTAHPPVCRIVDFGKFRYELSKKEKHSKPAAASKLKELKFHINIDPHDLGIKMNHARGFLNKGMRVKMSVVLRGREMVHAERSEGLISQIQESLGDIAHAEAAPRMVGRSIHLMMVPSHGKKVEKPLKVEGLKRRSFGPRRGPAPVKSASFGQGIDISKGPQPASSAKK